jgi:hypothetical protein
MKRHVCQQERIRRKYAKGSSKKQGGLIIHQGWFGYINMLMQWKDGKQRLEITRRE